MNYILKLSFGIFLLCLLFSNSCELSPEKQNGRSVTILQKGATSSQDANAKCEDGSSHGSLQKVNGEIRVCQNGAWVTINATGPKGDKGDPGTSSAPTDPGFLAVWKENIASAARIELVYESQFGCLATSGSGFVIGQDVVATNGHVSEDNLELKTEEYGSFIFTEEIFKKCTDLKMQNPSLRSQGFVEDSITLRLSKINVWFPEGTSNNTRAYDREPDAVARKVDRTIAERRDIDFIEVNTGTRKPVKLSSRLPATDGVTAPGILLNEPILLTGFSDGEPFAQFAEGRIAFFQTANSNHDAVFKDDGVFFRIDDGTQLIGSTVPSMGGSSGGAMFDRNGEVVGINFGGSNVFQYAVSIHHLKDQLALARTWTAIPNPANSNGFNLPTLADKISPKAGSFNHPLIITFPGSSLSEIDVKIGNGPWQILTSGWQFEGDESELFQTFLNESASVFFRAEEGGLEFSANYTITLPPASNVTVSGKIYQEVSTVCGIDQDFNGVLKGYNGMTLKNDAVLGAGKLLELDFRVPDFTATGTQALKNEVSADIDGSSYNVKPGDSCFVQVANFSLDGAANGSLTCRLSNFADETIVFNAIPWSCDSWDSSYD